MTTTPEQTGDSYRTLQNQPIELPKILLFQQTACTPGFFTEKREGVRCADDGGRK